MSAGSAEETDSPRRELPPSMVERMTLILDAFDGPLTRLTLEGVARRTHLPRSTAHRILDQLVKLQWLEHTSFGYSLGRRALSLGGLDNGHGEIRAAAATFLHDLQMRTGMVVQLATLDGPEVFYLDKVGGRFAASVPSRVGGRAPAHSTALGKAMLAWLAPEEVDTLLGTAVARLTTRTISDLGLLHQELDRIRRRGGLAFERGECIPTIACAAAAVRGSEGPLAGISLVGQVNTPLEKAAPLVVHAARQVSQALHPAMETRWAQRRMAAVPTEPRNPVPGEPLDRMLAAKSNDRL
ncbi:IclR family transcriptional regulator [Halopolyspora algeriensis]|uniref:IclR family transcriptional regulator n=1 Tax=Halopolyspora algeriensis TaxID=1500506 RepID=A0A368W0G6_9ACTN|nr:IclR family transcriptional regulator [Halopolyspora algeriensis]RCW46071.1 IclR family transcriptional regulator [Halopolyspora algeriensis]TQM55477.1 IclR family transcriptional regulator [Halopolyspora algeriensis]